MGKQRVIRSAFIIGIFIFLPILFFRNYVFGGVVPFPGNLLVSYYSPWKYEPIAGYPNGVPNKPIGFDNLKLFYPYRKFSTDELSAGRLPLWNPYVFSGNVHAATYQAAIWYPLNIIYHVLPMIDAWSMLVVAQPVIALIGMWLFLRSIGFGRLPAVFGAVVYAFSGWMMAWWEESLVIVHSIVWLPYALYGSTLIHGDRKTRGFLVLWVTIALSVLAGFLQMTLYLLGTVAAWNTHLYLSRKQKNQTILPRVFMVLMSFVVAALITAPQWLPALEAYGNSPRGVSDVRFLFTDYLMPARHLLTLVAPDYWGNPGTYNQFDQIGFYHEKVIWVGIVPLLFALLVILERQTGKARFWKWFTLVTLSLGFALPTSWLVYYSRLPVLSMALPSRIFALSAFGLAVVSAYGFASFLAKPDWRRFRFPFSLVFLLILSGFGYAGFQRILLGICAGGSTTALWSGAFDCGFTADRRQLEMVTNYATVSLRNLVVPSGFFILTVSLIAAVSVAGGRFGQARIRRLATGAFLAVTLISSLYFARKYLYFSQRQFVFPETAAIRKLRELSGYGRVWAYGDAYAEKNILTYFGLYSPEGYDALYPQRYGELLSLVSSDGTYVANVARTDADLKPMSEIEPMDISPIRLRLMQLTNVEHVLERKSDTKTNTLMTSERFPEPLFSSVWEDDHFRIWKYQEALPRAYFVSQAEYRPEGRETLMRLIDPDFRPGEAVLVDEPDLAKESVSTFSDSPAAVDIQVYQPTHVELRVSPDQPGYVVLSDQYDSGWSATVNGVRVPILRANHTFRAIAVPSGTSTVAMIYRPRSLVASLLISCIGAVLMMSTLAVGLWRNMRNNVQY